MKLLDIFSGYTATTGTVFIHFSYMVACVFFKISFAIGISNKESADLVFTDLVDSWFWAHFFVFLSMLLRQTLFINHNELTFAAMLISIFIYQTMILKTTIAHIKHCLDNNLHFFYVEDVVHFLLFSEMMIFCANFITNIIVLIFASLFDIK